MYIASNGIKTAVILQDENRISPRDPDYQDNLGTMVCWHRKHLLGDEHGYNTPRDFLEDLAGKYLDYKDVFAAARDGVLDGYRLRTEIGIVNLKPIDSHYSLECLGGPPGHQTWQRTGWRATMGLDFITSGGRELEYLFSDFTTKDLLQVLDHSNKVVVKPLYLYDHSMLSMSTGSFAGRAHHADWDSSQVGFIYLDKETTMKEIAMPGDKVRLAKPLSTEEFAKIPLSPNKTQSDTLRDAGFTRVSQENISYADAQARYSLEESAFNISENQELYKKGHKLYAFAGYRPDDYAFILRPVATFNPNLLPLTEETWKGRAEEVLNGEVTDYDNYLQGEIYGYTLYEGLKEVESVWGFNPGSEDIESIIKSELGDWFEKDMEFEDGPGGQFDIEEYMEENNFPELRSRLRREVVDLILFEDETSHIYPFAVSAMDLLTNKDGILDAIVNDLYDEHVMPDTDHIFDTISRHAGIARALQPTITSADLAPGRDYTADEVMDILKKKPSLADQIASAAARQSTQSVQKSPEHEQGR